MPYYNLLFFAAFLSQILLISFYYPRKILRHESFVLETYPPSKYPKLYPNSPEAYKAGSRSFKYLFNFILLLGLLLSVLLLTTVPSTSWDDMVAFYFMLQLVPIFYLEISAYKTFKLMRRNNSLSTRVADLQPRHLFNFVSPKLVGIAVFMYICFMLFILFMSQNDLYVGNAANIKMISVTVSNLLFIAIIYSNLNGKKLNPHQAHQDRMSQMELVITQMVLISIASTGFLAFDTMADFLTITELMPFFQSVFLQLVAVISLWGFSSSRMKNIDFEVYKKDSAIV